MKTLLILLLFPTFFLLAQDRLNPRFPRTASYSLGQSAWPTYSIGTRLHKLAQYDMAYIYGSVDDNGTIKAQRMRQLAPDKILIAMGLNGIYFSDPTEFYLYRSYRGHLVNNIVPGQRLIPVDTVENINQGLGEDQYRFCYAVIDKDVIDVQYVVDDTIVALTDPEDFYAVNVPHFAGDSLISPLRLSGPGIFPNFSQWCPEVDGKYVWDYLAEKNLQSKIEWDYGLFDGLFHDAFYARVWLQDHTMDMNLNGVDDYEEYGMNWINAHWQEHLVLWLNKELDLMDGMTPSMPNMLGVNNGGTCEWFYDQLNGHCFEGFLRWSDWYYLKNDCLEWKEHNENNNRPSMMFIEDYIPEKWTFNGKDRFTKMRYGLSTALLFDCYYGMTFGDWYYIMLWYDEFETDLGFGTSAPFALPNGLWVRYFDKGAVVCNPTGASQMLNPSDLNDGRTYYRLRGGQDPVVNNGEIFNAPIEIYGHTYGSTDKRGDGLLLFTEPTTSVSDIIVDNFYHNDTSPGSMQVELEGDWQRKTAKGYLDFSQNNPFWSQLSNKQVVGDFDDAWGYHAVAGGTGSSIATWRPTIGVPGYYEICEWHGWHGDTPSSSQEASNVPYKIVINGDLKLQGFIDQTGNYGQWNLLGYAYMPTGTNSYVQINNQANGVVIADAVRFRYLGESAEPDVTPPQSPQNLRIIPQ